MINSFRQSLTGFVFLLFLGGCSALNPTQVTTSHQAVDFAKMKSYQWYSQEIQDAGLDPAIASQIQSRIDEKLAEKGLLKTTHNPDLYLRYSVTAQDRQDIQTFNSVEGFAPGFQWNRFDGFQQPGMETAAEPEVIEYKQGSLVIDFLDPQPKPSSGEV